MLYYLRIRRCYHYSDYEIEEFLGAKGSFSERIHMRCPRIEEDPADDRVLTCGLRAKVGHGLQGFPPVPHYLPLAPAGMLR